MKKTLITLTSTIVLATGCAQQSFKINGDSGSLSKETSQHFFVSGIGQKKELNAAEVCGGADKVISVETQTTALNIVLDIVTLGIYTPRDARVYCKA